MVRVERAGCFQQLCLEASGRRGGLQDEAAWLLGGPKDTPYPY